MSTTVQVVDKPTLSHRIVAFYHDVMAEMRKVTWPDWPQVRQLSIGVVFLSLFIGVVIWVMDFILQLVLVSWLPKLFGG
ncbi:MAG: preprotein translocase subunit SecE [Gemmatimonadetes bacterium]|nr:preprotein translocase subunit SecE [Gemmatimonadota bacterium]